MGRTEHQKNEGNSYLSLGQRAPEVVLVEVVRMAVVIVV